MTMTDPIADMLTRIRNAVTVRHDYVNMPASKMKAAIAEVLKEEGFILQAKEVISVNEDLDIAKAISDRERILSTGIGLGIAVQATMVTAASAWFRQRDRTALFGEWEKHLNPQWLTLLGLQWVIAAPASTASPVTTPSLCAVTGFSIFMASSTTIRSPASQSWRTTSMTLRPLPEMTYSHASPPWR